MADNGYMDTDSYWSKRLSRRRILRVGGGLGVAAALGAMAIGCGDDDEPSTASTGGGASGGDTIKVGILHSLSGTMAISEMSVRTPSCWPSRRSTRPAACMGKKLEPVVEDGASDWPTFAEKAKKLIQSDKVASVFGCWTSASRKAVLPVFEGLKGLLWYPVQYEGLESSPNIFYTGATTNQQIVPSVEYLLQGEQEEVLPARLRLRLPAHRQPDHQGAARGQRRHRRSAEEYTPARPHRLQHGDQQDPVGQPGRRLQHAERRQQRRLLQAVQGRRLHRREHADAVGLHRRGRGPRHRRRRHGRPPGRLELLPDHEGRRRTRSSSRPTRPSSAPTASPPTPSRPATSASTSGRRRSRRPARPRSTRCRRPRRASSFDAPEGKVTVNGENQHISKTVRIGKIRADGLIDEIWATPGPVEPDPYLETYSWGGEFAKQKKS